MVFKNLNIGDNTQGKWSWISGLAIAIKKNYTRDLVYLGTDLLEYSVPEASDQYHYAKPKSSCSVLGIKNEHVYKVRFHLYIRVIFLKLFTYVAINEFDSKVSLNQIFNVYLNFC